MTVNVGRIPQQTDLPLNLLHITDLHLFADADGELRGVNSDRSLMRVIEHARSSGWPAAAALVTGDLIQDDSKAAYERCWRRLETLELPIYLSPGNHDIRALMLESLPGPPFHYCETIRRAGWSVISLDSCVDGRAGGRVSDAELERLRHELDDDALRHALVCLHHPPVELGSRWLDAVGLENAESVISIASESGKVRGLLFGHAHQQFEANRSGIDILGTPATTRQFKPGSDEFAVDDRPAAYRRLSLDASGRIDSEVVWMSND